MVDPGVVQARSEGQVDAVADVFAPQGGQNLVSDFDGDAALGFGGGRAEVGGMDDFVVADQRMVRGWGLHVVHIYGRAAEVTGVKGTGHGSGIYQPATSCID